MELLVGDVRERADVVRALEGIDAVYHFAAQTGVGQSMYNIHGYCDVNIGGTAMLLDVLANRRVVKKVILSSSRAVYGEGACRCNACGTVHPAARSREQLERGEWDLVCPGCGGTVEPFPTGEETPLDPISVYALTKRVQEDLLRTFSSSYGIPSVILRYFNVYGCPPGPQQPVYRDRRHLHQPGALRQGYRHLRGRHSRVATSSMCGTWCRPISWRWRTRRRRTGPSTWGAASGLPCWTWRN